MADHSETARLRDRALNLLVPRGAVLRGAISSDVPQLLLLEGHFVGRVDLKGASRVVIAQGAVIDGECIQAHTVVVHGRVNGHVHAQVLELGPTAQVCGSLRYDLAFASQPGARIRAGIQGPEDEDEDEPGV